VYIYRNGNKVSLQHRVGTLHVYRIYDRAELNIFAVDWTIGVRFPVGMDDGKSCTWSVATILKSVVIQSNTTLFIVETNLFLQYSATCSGIEECYIIS
jgi:hypothetical protein